MLRFTCYWIVTGQISGFQMKTIRNKWEMGKYRKNVSKIGGLWNSIDRLHLFWSAIFTICLWKSSWNWTQVWCDAEKAHFPIRPTESHINKLHKYFLYKRKGELSVTPLWNLSGALFMCVTERLHCPPLPSLQMGRTPGLQQLYCCHSTCLHVGFFLWRTCAGSVRVGMYLFSCEMLISYSVLMTSSLTTK